MNGKHIGYVPMLEVNTNADGRIIAMGYVNRTHGDGAYLTYHNSQRLLRGCHYQNPTKVVNRMAEYIFEIDVALYNDENQEVVMKPEYKGWLLRCKDCIWWDNSPLSTMTPMHRACKRVGRMGTQAEDFCSFGERRDNGHD